MAGPAKRYEQVPHTADLAAKIYGKSITELFENAAYAMFSLISDIDGLEGGVKQRLAATGPDLEALLVKWLNELLYLSFKKKMFLCRFKIISLKEGTLVSEVGGVAADTVKDKVAHEIKAATYHGLAIKKNKGRYETTVIFDV